MKVGYDKDGSQINEGDLVFICLPKDGDIEQLRFKIGKALKKQTHSDKIKVEVRWNSTKKSGYYFLKPEYLKLMEQDRLLPADEYFQQTFKRWIRV